MNGSKRNRHGNALPGAVHLKVVSNCVGKSRESGRKRAFADEVCNRFKTGCAYLRVILPIDEKRAFVKDIAGRRDRVVGEAYDVDENWDSDGMASVYKVAVSGACNKTMQIQRLCDDETEVEPTSFLEMIDLSWRLSRQSAILQSCLTVLATWRESWRTCGQ